MGAELNHECDNGDVRGVDHCLCDKCLEEIKQESYDKGYAQAQQDERG